MKYQKLISFVACVVCGVLVVHIVRATGNFLANFLVQFVISGIYTLGYVFGLRDPGKSRLERTSGRADKRTGRS